MTIKATTTTTELAQIKAALTSYDKAVIRELRRELKADHFVLELHREHPMLTDCACAIAAEWRGKPVQS